jgi:hypothetical protein
MPPNLHESAWTRAVSKSAGLYTTAAFGVGVALAEAVVVPISILFTASSSRTEVQIVVPILAGALTLALSLLSVFFVQLMAAAVQQRNELRAGWATTAASQAVHPEIQLLNFARVGEEKAQEMNNRDTPTQWQRTDAEEWTNAVVEFLEAHVPARGREFLEAGRNWGADSDNLHLRIEAKAQQLRDIASDLSDDPEAK